MAGKGGRSLPSSPSPHGMKGSLSRASPSLLTLQLSPGRGWAGRDASWMPMSLSSSTERRPPHSAFLSVLFPSPLFFVFLLDVLTCALMPL